MGKIWRLRNVAALASMLALAAVLVLLGRGGGNVAEAHTFAPGYTITLSNDAPGVNAALTEFFDITAPDSFFGTPDPVLFTPADVTAPEGEDGWPTPDYASVAIGAIVGESISGSTLGLLGAPCTSPAPVPFAPMMNSTVVVSTDDPDEFGPTFDNWTGFGDGPLALGLDASIVGSEAVSDGIPDAVTTWPKFLDPILAEGTTATPLARHYGQVLDFAGLVGTSVALNLIIYAPGDWAGIDASEGFPMVVVLENTNPLAPSEPSDVTDICAPLDVLINRLGVSVNHPDTAATEGGVAIWTNPTDPGSYTFSSELNSWPDADEDGIENDLDTCPFVPNLEDPRLSGAGGNPDVDGIDSACDNVGVFTDAAVLPWSATDVCRAGGVGAAGDCDGDGFRNRDDKCPLVADTTDADSDGDRIGDACDVGAGPETGTDCDNAVDDDGDYAINDGCYPADTDPESGLECSNNLDDDDGGPADGSAGNVNEGCPERGGSDDTVDGEIITFKETDVATISPLHDIAIKSLKGRVETAGTGGTGYKLRLENNGPVTETVQVMYQVIVLPPPPLGPPVFCSAPAIDVNGDGVISPPGTPGFPPFGENLTIDLNGDTRPDTLAFFLAGPIGTGANNKLKVDFDILWGTSVCQVADFGFPDQTPLDYIVRADICHSGDLAPLGFLGADCATVQAPDGGTDTSFANDGPVTFFVNNTTFLTVP